VGDSEFDEASVIMIRDKLIRLGDSSLKLSGDRTIYLEANNP